MTPAQQSKAIAQAAIKADESAAALKVARAIIAERAADKLMMAWVPIPSPEDHGHVVLDVKAALLADGYECSAPQQDEFTFKLQVSWNNA